MRSRVEVTVRMDSARRARALAEAAGGAPGARAHGAVVRFTAAGDDLKGLRARTDAFLAAAAGRVR